MTARHVLTLTQHNRDKAIAGVVAAPNGYVLELREPTRSTEQNAALWSLLSQVAKQRPTHNGVKMSADLWKAVFLDALGTEMTMLPKLDGQGYFPLGHRSSRLTKSEFSALLELILSWTAREGIEVRHFDDGQGGGSGTTRPPMAA